MGRLARFIRFYTDDDDGNKPEPGIWKTIKGALIHITDALASPMQKCEVTLEPIQDLHGQDAPYPAGGGKNKFNPDNMHDYDSAEQGVYYYSNLSELFTIWVAGRVAPFDGEEGVTYTVSAKCKCGTAGNVGIGFQYSDGTYSTGHGRSSSTDWFTAYETSDPNKKVIGIGSLYGTNGSAYFKDLQIEISPSVTSYAPFENICPISGWAGVNAYATGKVLGAADGMVDCPNYPTRVENTDWGIALNSVIQSLKAGTYKYQVEVSGLHPSGSRNIRLNYTDGTLIMLYLPYDDSEIYVYTVGIPDGMAEKTLSTIQIYGGNNGTTDRKVGNIKFYLQDDTPASDDTYQGTTLSVTFPDTVYGGSHEFVSGSGQSKMASVDLGTLNWQKWANIQKGFYAAVPGCSGRNILDLCSAYKHTQYSTVVNGTEDCVFALTATTKMIYLYDSAYQDLDATSFKTAMSGVQLVYELATPIEIQLTPQPISTLKGENNVWANSNGEATVIYKAQAE